MIKPNPNAFTSDSKKGSNKNRDVMGEETVSSTPVEPYRGKPVESDVSEVGTLKEQPPAVPPHPKMPGSDVAHKNSTDS